MIAQHIASSRVPQFPSDELLELRNFGTSELAADLLSPPPTRSPSGRHRSPDASQRQEPFEERAIFPQRLPKIFSGHLIFVAPLPFETRALVSEHFR